MSRIMKSILKIAFVFFIVINIVVICHAYKFTHYYKVGEIIIKPQKEKTLFDEFNF